LALELCNVFSSFLFIGYFDNPWSYVSKFTRVDSDHHRLEIFF